MAGQSAPHAIVIGAGCAGLTAAALLARSGLRVTVLEEQPVPGGYMQGFARRGFTFDTAIQWLNNCGPGDFVPRVFGFAGLELEACRPLARIRRYRGESFDYLLTDEPHLLREQLMDDFPAERDGIDRFFRDAHKLGTRLLTLDRCMRAVDSRGPIGATGFGLKMLSWYLPLRRFIRAPQQGWLERYLEPAGAGRIFCAEEQLMAAMVPVGWGYSGDCYAPPVGGSQVWMRALAEHARSMGADLRLGQGATGIRVEGGRARAVRTAAGEEIAADWVVAACDLERLQTELLPTEAVDPEWRSRQREADLYYSQCTVFLGLDCPAGDFGLGEELCCLTRDGLPRAEHSSGEADSSALIVLAPSERDPGLAPEGKGTLTIHCSTWLDRHERWHTGPDLARGDDYRTFKRDFARALIERVERSLAPGLSARIEVQEVATPVTYWRYTRNRDGSIMGQRPSEANIKARLAGNKTPIGGLILAGHWAEYGGGLPMAVKSAANASLRILRRVNKEGFRALARAMDGR